MRRLAVLSLLGILALSACRRQGEFSPDEVLRRATLASGQLESAEYGVALAISVRNAAFQADGNATLKGSLAHGGREAAFVLSAQGTMDRSGQKTVASVSADVVSEQQDVYVKLRSLSMVPVPDLGGAAQNLLGTWWKIPQGDSPLPAQQLTPDPAFLRAQAAVVKVVTDHGLERVNGSDAYHYTVSVDPDRLAALMKTSAEEQGRPFDAVKARGELLQYDATGELWIDTGTFFIHRLSWTVTAKDSPSRLRFSFRADLSSHNAVPPVAIPTDFGTFRREDILRALLPATASGALSR